MKKQKKIYVFHLCFVLSLIVLDELIKFYIVHVKNAQIDVCNSTGELIHFHPTYNTAGSFLALKTGLTYSQTAFMLFALIVSIVVVCLGLWYKQQLDMYRKGTGVLIVFDIMLAGCAGRVVERFFWQYTLDYIAIKGVAICDMLDLYMFFGAIGITIVAMYLDIKKKRLKCYQKNIRNR